MNYYCEFGGGLGDVFQQIFAAGQYASLERLFPEDRVEVVIISHNPHVHELFEWHPRRNQFAVRSLGYWLGEEDQARRKEHGIHPFNRAGFLPRIIMTLREKVRFYPSPADLAILEDLGQQRMVVFSVSAGLPDRDVPEEIVIEAVQVVLDCGMLPVFVGRSYDRHGRKEQAPHRHSLNLIDKLSVPGVAALVQASSGVVACHSSISMLAWYERKPHLLFYPESVEKRHFERPDQWAFGLKFPECSHARFDDHGGVIEALNDFQETLRPTA